MNPSKVLKRFGRSTGNETLSKIHVYRSGDRAVLQGTDMLTRVWVSSPCSSQGGDGTCSVDSVDYMAGDAAIPSPVGNYPAEPMPEIPSSATTISASATEWKWLLAAMSSDEARPELCVVRLDGGRGVATDGHRMHVLGGVVADSVIARSIIDDLAEVVGECLSAKMSVFTWSCDKCCYIGATGDGITIVATCRQQMLRYPEWQRVIHGNDPAFKISDFAQSMPKMKAVKGNTLAVRFARIDGVVMCESDGAEIAHKWEASSSARKFGEFALNAKYLTDSAGKGTWSVAIKNRLSAIRFDNGMRTAIVMPLNLEARAK